MHTPLGHSFLQQSSLWPGGPIPAGFRLHLGNPNKSHRSAQHPQSRLLELRKHTLPGPTPHSGPSSSKMPSPRARPEPLSLPVIPDPTPSHAVFCVPMLSAHTHTCTHIFLQPQVQDQVLLYKPVFSSHRWENRGSRSHGACLKSPSKTDPVNLSSAMRPADIFPRSSEPSPVL